jgi:hypothetical protein
VSNTLERTYKHSNRRFSIRFSFSGVPLFYAFPMRTTKRDGLPQVKFWVRNLVRKSTSFRLQTSKDWFYPDFLCQLVDGRVLAVEYKGKHLWTDAEEKRAIGAVWASRSKGHCLFIMPTAGDFSALSQAVKPL